MICRNKKLFDTNTIKKNKSQSSILEIRMDNTYKQLIGKH